MFTRYWRTYPWFLQLFLFAMMVLTFSSLGSYVVLAFLPKLTGGITLAEALKLGPNSPVAIARAALLVQAITHASAFAIPCLVFAYLMHPKAGTYLGLRAPGQPLHWLVVPGIMIGFLLFSLYLESWLVQHVHLQGWMKKMQDQNNDQMAGMLGLKSTPDLIKAIAIMAALPALGEELMFRGILMRFAHQRNKKRVFPVIISALLFTALHANPLGMPFIFSAGIILALIYWLTGSLWCSILGHFVYNGIQVVAVFLSNTGGETQVPAYIPVIGLALFLGCGYALIKTQRPLPPDWSDDFAGDKQDTVKVHSSSFSS